MTDMEEHSRQILGSGLFNKITVHMEGIRIIHTKHDEIVQKVKAELMAVKAVYNKKDDVLIILNPKMINMEWK